MESQQVRNVRHQYIERHTGRVLDEKLYADRMVNFLYSGARENPSRLFNSLTGARMSTLLGFVNYDTFVGGTITGGRSFLGACGIDWSECVAGSAAFKSLRDVFERKIRYWECRPMPKDQSAIVAPADSRMIVGSLAETSGLFLKGKFFDLEELLGTDKEAWQTAFEDADYAVFRLTPDKYHYNHTPVCGMVKDLYEIPGKYHSCNPGAVVTVATPYSKNKRVVTIMDTDLPGGSEVGLVAMIEVVALMIGDIVQCYSEERYEAPRPVMPGMILNKGLPKSLYRPGSSTDVLLFEKGRMRFAEDLVRNTYLPGVQSRFSSGFGNPLVETEVKVRSFIGVVSG
jgi:phosphatidylserine decarboxylase